MTEGKKEFHSTQRRRHVIQVNKVHTDSLLLCTNAALFKVHLPIDAQKKRGENIIVKILEFSPEVMVSIYVKTVDMCFKYGIDSYHQNSGQVCFWLLCDAFHFFYLFGSERNLTVCAQTFSLLDNIEIQISSSISHDCSFFFTETCVRSLQFVPVC